MNDDGAIDLLDAATYQRGLANVLPTALDEDNEETAAGGVGRAVPRGMLGARRGKRLPCFSVRLGI